jgi:hypothetical protein
MFDVLIQLGQFEPFVSEIVDRLHRLDRELKHSAQSKLERNRKSGAQITLAIAACNAVDRQHHDVDARVFCS